MASSSSSSSNSTLSAKALPFIPPQTRSSQSNNISTNTSNLSAKAAPFTKKPNSTSNLNNTPLIGTPFYPSYDSGLVPFDGISSSNFDDDDVLDSSCDFDGYNGVSVVPWNAPFDGEVEQLDKSDVRSSPCKLFQGVRPKVTITPVKVSGPLEGAFSSQQSQPSKSESTTKSCNALNSNSCYNHHVAQIYSSSSNSLPGKSITSQKGKPEKGFDEIIRENVSNDKFSGIAVVSKPVKLHKVIALEMSTRKDDSMENYSETLDDVDIDLDSPCWKGTQAYKRSPFHADNETTVNHLEKFENLILDKTEKVSVLSNAGKTIDVTFPSLEKKCEEQITNMMQNHCRKNVEKGKEALHNINVEHSSGVNATFTKTFEQKIDATLHCLRKRLVSRDYKDENELNELLNEVLLLVNDYPEAIVLKNKKGIIANGSYNDYRTRSRTKSIQNSMEKDENIISSHNIRTFHEMDMNGTMQPIGYYTANLQGSSDGSYRDSMLEFDQSHILGIKCDTFSQSNIPMSYSKVNNFPSDIDVIKSMANDFERVLKKSFCEHEEDIHTLVHKNLWIEAQVKLFSMKYELQLARVENEILKHYQRARGRFQEVGILPSLRSLEDPQTSNPLFVTGNASARDFHPSAGESYISFRQLLS